jgi:hypothetical protein
MRYVEVEPMTAISESWLKLASRPMMTSPRRERIRSLRDGGRGRPLGSQAGDEEMIGGGMERKAKASGGHKQEGWNSRDPFRNGRRLTSANTSPHAGEKRESFEFGDNGERHTANRIGRDTDILKTINWE